MKNGSARKHKLVGINELGCRVGETHHRARLTDHDVDLIRELCDPDDPDRLTYQEAADKFECGKTTVADIVKCRRRWQRPDKWKRVSVDD